MNSKLKDLRLKSGFTQADFAKFLSMPYRTYQNYELSTTTVPVYLYKLIEFRVNDYLNQYTDTKGIYTIKQIKAICKKVFKRYHIKSAYLFGDYMKKTANEYSYVKFLVKSSNSNNLFELKKDLDEAFHKTIEVFDIYELDRKGEFVQEILKKGIIVYRSYKNKNLLK